MDDLAIEAVAHHEAGHAVVAWALDVKLRREGVTIVPDDVAGSLGSCASRQPINRSIEWNRSDRNRIRAERKVQICLAGEVTQRRYDARSVKRDQGVDWRRAQEITIPIRLDRQLAIPIRSLQPHGFTQ
jgi:hypothetical protein